MFFFHEKSTFWQGKLVTCTIRQAWSDFEKFCYFFEYAFSDRWHWCHEYQLGAISCSSRHEVLEIDIFEILPWREIQAQVKRSHCDHDGQVEKLMNPQCLIQLSNDRFPHASELFFHFTKSLKFTRYLNEHEIGKSTSVNVCSWQYRVNGIIGAQLHFHLSTYSPWSIRIPWNSILWIILKTSLMV